ncbi:MAG: hypothetical protein HOV66_26605 [Streptomycetaceae bacterium]|nr:hypothetical protein [Mycobacteriaceae bacterium]NUS58392.1 hypothetical protein [Streptomycetaceae bacterium]
MSERALSVESAGLSDYSNRAAAVGAELASAAAQASVAGPGLLGPVLGLIGGDFVAAYTAAANAHVDSIARLSTTVASLSAAAKATVAGYHGVDTSTARAVTQRQPEIQV